MHSKQQLPKKPNTLNILSQDTIKMIQLRLEASQPIKLPKAALDDLYNNISKPGTIMALLGEQIITTHNLIMTLGLCAGTEIRNSLRDRLPATCAMVKLINAFSRQVELLEYLKDPSTKSININKVSVSENAQAFVGAYSRN